MYRPRQIVNYIFRCFFLRRKESLKKIPGAKEDLLLNKGIKKLENDLDIVVFLEMLHGFRVMKKTLFTKDERFLLHH